MQKHIKLSEITVKDRYITCRNVHSTPGVRFYFEQQQKQLISLSSSIPKSSSATDYIFILIFLILQEAVKLYFNAS